MHRNCVELLLIASSSSLPSFITSKKQMLAALLTGIILDRETSKQSHKGTRLHCKARIEPDLKF